jgi:hypothetical protein
MAGCGGLWHGVGFQLVEPMMAIALGVGALIGYMVAHRRSRNGDRERYESGLD